MTRCKMPWQAMLMKFPACGDIDNLPKDWKIPSIGTLAETRAKLEEAFPDGCHVDGQTVVRGTEFSIAFDYDDLPDRDGLVKSVGISSSASRAALPALR